ncbi:hypothetical protein EDM68_03745 [Candidatus Uhrbacteria bacterium]|nr:MAG: hypothetical protein EDM68_03745 [Candidatus Uhrbacteria bacterium]
MGLLDLPSIDGLTEDQVLTLVYCRSYNQYVVMIEDYRVGKCSFCDPMDDRNKVIAEARGWRMWVNPFPIKHTSPHLILAPVRHQLTTDPISIEDFTAMGVLFNRAKHGFGFTGGGFVMRFGSPRESTGTVLHLHANIIVPDLTGPVEAPLAKSPEKIAAQVARMHVYEKLRLGARTEELTSEEFALVEGRL